MNGFYGVVRFQKACRKVGMRGIVGTELLVEGERLVLLTRSREGYAGLCRLLTELALNDDYLFTLLDTYRSDVICLAGARGGRIDRVLAEGDRFSARRDIGSLRDIYADNLFFLLSHHALEGDNRRLARALRFASQEGVPTVASNDVRYAEPDDYRRYDLLDCIRRNGSIFDPHPDRPANAEAWMKPFDRLYPVLIPREAPFARGRKIAEECRCDLLPDRVIPPHATLPDGTDPVAHLRALCEQGFAERISGKRQAGVRSQLEKELRVIRALDLEEYFLVVHEVVREAARRGIR